MKVAVIGGGHAGVEAALICKRNNVDTYLFTLDKKMISNMPCNPSIGGPAKGTVVREIDALGGQMAITTDKTLIQIKMLNSSKGPGVWSLRAQADKIKYPQEMQNVLEQEGVIIIEELVQSLIFEDKVIKGLLTSKNKYDFDYVIITTGTYMSSKILISDSEKDEGPDGQKTDGSLSKQLKDMGFRLQRLKTGTPPRVARESVDFSKTTPQPGDDKELTFSYQRKRHLDIKDQIDCYLTYTNSETHKIINNNISKSAMYSGVVRGVGPRYCPSIEDKIVRFADKERHQIFLEPESNLLNTIYVQGLSMSLPHDVQEKIIRTIPGLEECEILKYAYAIEYDAIDSTQLKASLESKDYENLFFAGQVNGTSGYEEAAAQGLVAGINVIGKINNNSPFILDRQESYIGVMIDDLVTKGTKEPYRLLTSRAENRIMIRNDNADMRLSKKAFDYGVLPKDRYDCYASLIKDVIETIKVSKDEIIKPTKENNELYGISFSQPSSIHDLIKRPDSDPNKLLPNIAREILERVVIEIRLEGYVNKFKRIIRKADDQDKRTISKKVDYNEVPNISIEAKEKLLLVRPETIGQASRISGVNPSDIMALLIFLKQNKYD